MSVRYLAFLILMSMIYGTLAFYLGYTIGHNDISDVNEIWLNKAHNDLPDRISVKDIMLFKDRIIVKGQFQLSEFMDSNSMLPVLDRGSNGISIPVYKNTTLYIGDVVSFRVPSNNFTMVHRIVDIKNDKEGIYYVTKGDNSYYKDPYKLRQKDILRLTIGVLW